MRLAALTLLLLLLANLGFSIGLWQRVDALEAANRPPEAWFPSPIPAEFDEDAPPARWMPTIRPMPAR